MAVAAEATRTLRVGCRVFCIDYRHSVMLAKEIATLDLLSEGRTEVGLGAGWLRGEYEAAGLQFDEPRIRIDRLEETIAAIKAFCTGEPLELKGHHVSWSGFAGSPASVQKPHPPIMVGGGSKRVLSIGAREANVVSLNFNNRSGKLGPGAVQSGTAEETAKKIGWIKDAAGGRMSEIELEIGAYFTFVTDQSQPVVEGMSKAMGLEPEQMRDHPHGLFGSVDEICERLEKRRELYGLSYITVGADVAEAFAPVVARLAGE
jgi:probable F420-dependent oxidoreductase